MKSINIKHLTRKIQLLSILSVIFLISCTAPIDIHTDNSEPVIVIYGNLTEKLDNQSVRVSSSSPYFANQPNPGISGAIVTISSSNNDVFELQENDTVKGLYQTVEKMAGIPGLDYTLTVEVDFNKDGIKEIYQAKTSMLEPIQIDSITVTKLRTMGKDFYSVNLYGLEPPTEDYYLCKYLVNDSSITNKISQYELQRDEIFNDQYIDGMLIRFFRDEKYRDDYSDEDQKDITFLKSGDKVTLNISRIVKGYFDFVAQCQNEMDGENPFFGGPASNITTNVSNGGVGYFTGYTTTTVSSAAP